jgi:hypothetical protein
MSHHHSTVHKYPPHSTLYHTNMKYHRITVHKFPTLSTPLPHHVTSPQYRPQIPTTQYPCTAPTFHITTVQSTNPHHSLHCTTPTCHITTIPSTNPQNSVPLYCTKMSHHRSTVHKSPPTGTLYHSNMSHHRSTVHKSPPLSTSLLHQHVTSPHYRLQIPTTQYTCNAPTCHITTVPSTNPHHSVPQYRTNMSHHHNTFHNFPPLSTLLLHQHVT